jgi:tryptophan synthase alpha chain
MTTPGGDRIAKALASAGAAKRPALAAFITAGFPSRLAWPESLQAVAASCDVVEIGIPFSDPMADGATIQRASRVALAGGTTLGLALAALAATVPKIAIPVVVMSYMNPLLAYGVSHFARDAAAAGVCGAVVPDLPLEEQGLLEPHLRRHGVALIQMVTPTTPEPRLRELCAKSDGFVYAVTLRGTTGSRIVAQSEIAGYLQSVRAAATCPVLAGFGVRSRRDVAALVPPADGVVVGSALIEAIESGEDPGVFLSNLIDGPIASQGGGR